MSVYIEMEPEVDKLIKLHKELSETMLSLTKTEEMIQSITGNEKRLKTAKNQLKENQQYYSKNFPEICPLCEKQKS